MTTTTTFTTTTTTFNTIISISTFCSVKYPNIATLQLRYCTTNSTTTTATNTNTYTTNTTTTYKILYFNYN